MADVSKTEYRFGEFVLIPSEGLLRKNGENVHLPLKVYAVLALLVERNGNLVTKDELVERVWNNAFVEEAAVSRTIWTIRNTLGEDSKTPKYIHTVPKRGYRFTGDVEIIDKQDEETSVDEPKEEIAVAADDKVVTDEFILPQKAERSKSKVAVTALAISMVMMVVIAGVYAGYRLYSAPRSIRSVAVMPFVNQTGDPQVEYLSDGITETIITGLSDLPNVSIKPRSTVFRYKGKEVDPHTVGKELGVDAVLSGSISQRGQEMIVFVELADIRSDKIIWSGQYKRNAADLALLEPEIVRDITDKLHIELSGEARQRLSKRYTSNPQAYELYLHGRFEWNKFSHESLAKSVEYFERAVQADPGYALAYSGMADAYINLGADYVSPASVMPKARLAAMQAIALDNSLAEAHTSLGSYKMFYEWNMKDAEKSFLMAISLDPEYANARHFYSHSLMFDGRTEEAIREMRVAVELEPLSFVNNAELGWTYYLAGRQDEAIEQIKKTINIDPASAYGYWMLGMMQAEKNDLKNAKVSLNEGLRLAPDWKELLATLAYTEAKDGEATEAEKMLATLIDAANDEYINPVSIAAIYAALNDNNKAIEWLEKGFQEKSSWMSWVAVEPQLASLRSDQRFQDLVKRIGK